MNACSVLLPALILLPRAGGAACFGLERVGQKPVRDILGWLFPLAELTIVCGLLPAVLSGGVVCALPGVCGLGLSLRLDGLRWVLCLMGSVLWLGSALFGLEYLADAHRKGRYLLYFLITQGATLGVFLSGDFYTLLVCFEVMSVASWTLVAHEETPGAMRAADSYLGFAVIGGLVTLMGLFLLYWQFGTLDIAALGALARQTENRAGLYLAGGLTLFGFAAKAGMWPLHTWLPAAHPVAPATASALLSGIITKAGMFGILCLSAHLFYEDGLWGTAIFTVGLVTMAVGAVLGVFSVNLKRTLACSSMSQIGFILTGVGMSCLLGEENAGAVHGLVLHMLNHSLFKLTLFLAAGAVFMNLHSLELDTVRGFGRGKPVLTFAFLMGLCGLAGVPGGSGYISKTLLHESIVEYIEVLEHAGGDPLLFRVGEWVFLASGGLTLAYMLKLFVCICVQRNTDPALQTAYDGKNRRWCTPLSAGVLVCCAALIPLLGLTAPVSMDGIAGLADGFFHVEETEAVAYFTFGNLKGSAISIAIGLLVYFGLVRTLLMREGRYVNRWPAGLDLENRVYRPLLLGVLPFAGALCARLVSSLPELVRRGLCRVLYAGNHDGYVTPPEDDLFTVYVQQPRGTRGYRATLSYSLLLFSVGVVAILIYLIV